MSMNRIPVPVHTLTCFPNSKIQPTRHLTPKFQIPFRISVENGPAVPLNPPAPPPHSQNQRRIAFLEPPFAIPFHHIKPGIRTPASFPGALQGCPLQKNHRDPAHGIDARDGARVSSSNSWDRVPDRRSNIPRRLRFLFFEMGR